jgi:hypothetical protein
LEKSTGDCVTKPLKKMAVKGQVSPRDLERDTTSVSFAIAGGAEQR